MRSETTPPDDEKSCMLLVMRVLSIVPLNFKVSLSRQLHVVVVTDYCFRFCYLNYRPIFPDYRPQGSALVRPSVTRTARVQLICPFTHAGSKDAT